MVKRVAGFLRTIHKNEVGLGLIAAALIIALTTAGTLGALHFAGGYDWSEIWQRIRGTYDDTTSDSQDREIIIRGFGCWKSGIVASSQYSSLSYLDAEFTAPYDVNLTAVEIPICYYSNGDRDFYVSVEKLVLGHWVSIGQSARYDLSDLPPDPGFENPIGTLMVVLDDVALIDGLSYRLQWFVSGTTGSWRRGDGNGAPLFESRVWPP